MVMYNRWTVLYVTIITKQYHITPQRSVEALNTYIDSLRILFYKLIIL